MRFVFSNYYRSSSILASDSFGFNSISLILHFPSKALHLTFIVCVTFPIQAFLFIFPTAILARSFLVIVDFYLFFIPVSSLKVFGHSIHSERSRIYLGKSIHRPIVNMSIQF